MKRGSKVCSLKENVFDIITDESAYWIGFILADGCINQPPSNRTKRLSVGLAPIDLEHLLKLRTFLGSNNKINRSHMVMLQVVSEKITAKLEEYGITQRKSTREKAAISLVANRDFWRGVFDGDGSIYWLCNTKGKRTLLRIKLVGSFDLLTQFCGFIQDGAVRKHGSIFSVVLAGRRAKRVLEILYLDSSISLERKKILAGKAMKESYRKSRGACLWEATT